MKDLRCVTKAESHAVLKLHSRDSNQELLTETKRRSTRGKLPAKVLELYPQSAEDDIETIKFTERMLLLTETDNNDKRKTPHSTTKKALNGRH